MATIVALAPGCDRLDVVTQGTFEGIDPITATEDFYVYQCCGTPEIDPETWTLQLRDREAEPVVVDLEFLDALQPVELEHTLQCIGGGPRQQLIDNALWSGLALVDVLDAVGLTIDPSIVELKLVGADEYATSIPITDLEVPVWMVWKMNGETLPLAHGGPARLLVPNRYGIKNPKWITEITLIDTPFLGRWETYGWSNTAEYLPNGLIASPLSFSDVPLGSIRILGTAFAGSDPIARVEVSTDDGTSWRDASIDYSPGPDVWTIWRFDWEPPEAGEYVLKVRVETEWGRRTNESDSATNSANGYDGSMEATIQVV